MQRLLFDSRRINGASVGLHDHVSGTVQTRANNEVDFFFRFRVIPLGLSDSLDMCVCVCAVFSANTGVRTAEAFKKTQRKARI